MPLFRRKSEKGHKTSSLSVYGQGRSQTPPCSGEKASFKIPCSPDETQQPFLAFAEVTYDPSLPMRSKSRLSKTLAEVLHDNAALAYFIQFMDFKNAKHLVKFWLDAESFHVSVTTRLRGLSDLEQSTQEQIQNFHRSDSSGCVSDRSDDIFHHSSHQQNCNYLLESKSNIYQTDTCRTQETSRILPESSCQNSSFVKPSLRQSIKVNNSDAISTTVKDIAQENTKGGPELNSDNCTTKFSVLYDSNDSHVNRVKPSDIAVFNEVHVVNRLHDKDSGSLSVCSVPELAEGAETLNLGCDVDPPQLGLVRLHTSIEQDAKSIYEKYIAHGAQFFIGINEDLHDQIKGNIFQCDGKIDPECFLPAQEFVVKRMDEEYFPSFLRSSFHCKHQIDVLTSGTVYLADVLYNDSALFYFMEFVEQENVRHLVDFLLMADNFQKHLISQGTYDGIQAQSDAMILYDKYFSLQATCPLGFSDSIRYEVEQNICREEGPKPDCFLKPVMILTQYIEKTYLLQFLSSQLYFKYISECIITIQTGGADFATQSKVSGSESGSEQSLPASSVNTLLAMDGKQPGTSSKVLKNIEDQDMRIDTGQFKPDSLWQRPLAGKLLMAHVDKLGRVVTEFEPEPDRRRESRISKAVKKLVNREEDKNQEDMAWQIAEMIVNDICSITMPEKLPEDPS